LNSKNIVSRERHKEINFDDQRGEKPKKSKRARIMTQEKFENPSTFSPILNTNPWPALRFSAYL
jgi:hypothetical protein